MVKIIFQVNHFLPSGSRGKKSSRLDAYGDLPMRAIPLPRCLQGAPVTAAPS